MSSVSLSLSVSLSVSLPPSLSLSVSQVKSAASYALGSIAVGNLPEYLPFVLQEISSSKRQYLLLHSLKEIISESRSATPLRQSVCVCVCLVLMCVCVCVCVCSGSASVTGLKPYVESVWTLLLKHCECQEEGTRNVVAECLGKLTLIDPETLLPRLKGYLLSGNQSCDQVD